MLRLAEKAFWPAKIPFPVMHVDTGHNFDEVIEFRDRRVAELGVRLVVASVQDDDRRRSRGRRTGPRASRNRLQTVPLLEGIEEQQVRRGLRRRPPRRREGPRQGARLLLPRRVRAVGPQGPAARAVEPLQRPPPPGRAHPGVPAVELDRARHLAVHRARGARAAVHLLRAPARGLRARRHADGGHRRDASRRGREVFETRGPVPHRRRHDLHRVRSSPTPTRWRRSSRTSPPAGSPSAARPEPTTGSPRPRWKTASARGTSDGAARDSRPPAPSTTARAR